MTILRNDIATHLNYGVRTGFLKGARMFVSQRGAFVQETASSGASENYTDIGAVPMPIEYVDMPQAKGIHEVNIEIANKDYEITLSVSHNAINDDRAGSLDVKARQAGQNFEIHKDKICFQALNGGDAALFGLCYDGQNFFSASHIDPSAEYQTAQNNLFDLSLSIDNFETVWVAGQNLKDGTGEPVGINHNLIIASPTNFRLAENVAGNPNVYQAANLEENPWHGMLKQPLFSPYLDTTAWFAVASDSLLKPIILQIRQAAQLTIWDEEKTAEGGTRFYKFHGRYNTGYGDWRQVLMGKT